MRRIALALLALAFAASACDREKTPSPSFGRATPVAAEPLPTPEPPPEGAWALAVLGTSEDGCLVGTPPDVVYLSGVGQDWQISLQPFFLDASGVLRGDSLSLTGAALSVKRPTIDCVIAERDEWVLTRSAPETLEGEFVRVRELDAGDACAEALPEGLELPCLSRWSVRLDHRSAKRAPKPQ